MQLLVIYFKSLMLIWGGLTVNCSKAPSVTRGCYVFPSLPKPVLMCAALGHPPAVALLGGGQP